MSNAIQQTKKPVILQYLDKYQDQIVAALPKHLNADRMSRIVMTEMRKTPALLKCNPKSLFGAIIQCSQLGLEPGNALGHAYLLPFRNNKANTMDVQLIIGYRGMIDLARRSNQIESFTARAVFEGDEFKYAYGINDVLEHVPCQDHDCGEITHVYAIAKLKGGGVQWDVMTKSQVDAVRETSKSKNNGPWVTYYEEMAKKTVVRRLFKFLPVSVEMQTAVGLDEQGEAGVQDNASIIDADFTSIEDMDLEPVKTAGVSALKKRLQDQEVQQEVPEEPASKLSMDI